MTIQKAVDCVYWIWFQLMFGIGTRRAELFMNYFDNPKQIFDEIKNNGRVAGMLGTDELNAVDAAWEQAETIKRRTLKKGVDIITPEHGDYPGLLLQIYSKPAVLYVKGDLSCLKNRLAIAMVGSRKHSEYGKEASAWIAKGLVKGDVVIVSGLAHGIDTECHMAALTAGGKSIGVLGCGIDVDYPKGNADVKRLLCENGAVVTEYPLGTEPRPGNFPVRNRIVSGMCHGVVVIEADSGSGSLLTAMHALEQGRDIFAVPGSIFSVREQGTHQLIRDGAKLTDGAQDIFDEYEYLGFWKNVSGKYNPADKKAESYSKKPPIKDNDQGNIITDAKAEKNTVKKRELPQEISDYAASIYKVMDNEAVTVDYITEITNIDVSKVLSGLTELEIYGLIESCPGRKFGIIPAN